MSIQSTINQGLSVGALLFTQSSQYQGKVQKRKMGAEAAGYEKLAKAKQQARDVLLPDISENVKAFGYNAETARQALGDLEKAYNLEPTSERAKDIEKFKKYEDFWSMMEKRGLEAQENRSIRAAVAEQRRMDAEAQATSQLQQRANEVRETRQLATNIAKARVGETLQDVPVTITSKEDTPVRESSEKVTERKEKKPDIDTLIKQSGMNPSAFTPETKAKMLAEYEKGGKA